VKQCFRCGEVKPLSEYYRHPRMQDGHLGKCKACTRADVRANRRKRRDHYAAYERERNQQFVRRVLRLRYQRRTMVRHREKAAARSAVARAVRRGRLVRRPCEVCGDTKTDAHHVDYARPLDVQWLCRRHHADAHALVTSGSF
jgi:hypothetical protein